MSDPRFARLKTDPRFRRPKKQQSKIVVDDRFKDIFEGKKKSKKGTSRVDKYGRSISENQDRDNLKKFYRLENDGGDEAGPAAVPDYARGEVLLESSDEEDEESDHSEIVTLGLDYSKPISVFQEVQDAEIDLDEEAFADLDAQAAAYASKVSPEDEHAGAEVERTRRIAVVNLDWDHVRAAHLYKVFSSLVSPTASAIITSSKATVHPDRERSIRGPSLTVSRGKVLNVRVYPSEFGKERMAKEEKEGPPVKLFKKRKKFDHEDEVNETNIHEVGGEEDYDEDALRTYQLERLRYYYAIVICDTVEAASHIYSELEGTELERSANIFDLSFVPDGMMFDEEYRDEATGDPSTNYKSLDFVTDALRHSRVKLTWDEDDPERNQVTRRSLTKKEIDESDFKAYIASSTSGSDDEDEPDQPKGKEKDKYAASRNRLRAMLLGGGDEELPEGWAREDEDESRDIDMQITFTPGLTESKDGRDETTLEKYEKKRKEKRKKRKEELKEKMLPKERQDRRDDFFDVGSEDEEEDKESINVKSQQKQKGGKQVVAASTNTQPRHESTAEELVLTAASDDPNAEPKHFDLKAIMKAEKKVKGKKRKKDKKKQDQEDNEIQEDFTINVKDDRFKALHDDHTFAIDPSNPQFKKTKSMAALLEERANRQRAKYAGEDDNHAVKKVDPQERRLSNLVESVKRKSSVIEQAGIGKRRKP